jgi:radical SAM-linked protein
VLRLRIAFSKEEPVRFLSHLEIVRVWGRALRRTGLPLSFTEGFNPHPKLSFASALAVGVTSEQEYVDVEMRTEVAPPAVHRQLQEQLPAGFTIHQVVPVPKTAPALMAVVHRATYRVTVPVCPGFVFGKLEPVLQQFLSQPSVFIVKKGKKGPKEVDIRPGIYSMTVIPVGKAVNFMLELQAGSQGNVRPEEVMQVLATKIDSLDWEGMSIHRTGLAIAEKAAYIPAR